ncbi:MAG: HAD hydrolase-like protein [Candidatus Parcubacteria bacterium]|nr:HAD hydrolase-like protein [Candidatus Parcubacteria bacterium]
MEKEGFNKIILFDFDGVIADSFDIAFEVQKIVHPGLTPDGYRDFFNGNINDWSKNLVKNEEAKKINQKFANIYIPRMKEVKIMEGIREAIIELEKSYKLVIISSSITSPIGDWLERNNIANYFDLIMGNDIHTSKIEKIKMIFEKYKAGPENCVFITDTIGDMKEAFKMGIKSIGVVWGFQDKEKLAKEKPFAIAEKPKDLVLVIKEYFNSF